MDVFQFRIVILMTVILSFQSPYLLYGADSTESCYGNALAWIEEIGASDSEIIEKSTLARCNFVKKWLDREGNKGDGRERLCNDLVLVWTHNECVYFRDDINHNAYEPCKAWSREMYRRCMNYDDAWFRN